MKTKEVFATLAEAKAFVKGINYVQDIDVKTEGPKREGKKYGVKKYAVTVIVEGLD